MLSKTKTPLVLALLVLAAPLALASPAGLDTFAFASATPNSFDYTVETVVADGAGTLSLVNADLRSHDIVATAAGPATNPWCARFATRACPLFASPLIGVGQQAVVAGTEQLTPLESYAFYCSIHPFMTGTLTAI